MSNKAHDKLIFNTCYHIALRGYKVILIIQNTGATDEEIFRYYSLPVINNLKFLKIKVSAFKISWKFLYRLIVLLKIFILAKKDKFSIVYVSELKLGALIVKFKKLLKIPVVYEFHNLKLLENNTLNEMEKYIIKNADGVIVTTNSLMEKIKNNYGRINLIEKIPLAGFSFDVKEYQQKKFVSHWKVFYVGQLYYLQGVDILIKAFNYLKEYPCSLHIIGGTELEIQELKKIANETPLNERIIFHGYKKPFELYKILSEADILVMPSRAEGRMPYVAHTKIYEYLSLGKPIIATDMESVQEVLTDGINAVIVEPGNSEALAKGIIKIILDPEFRQKISENALKESLNYT